jgi:hypothetical protein
MKTKLLLFFAILLAAASCSTAEPTIETVDATLTSASPADTTAPEPAESDGNLLELPTPMAGTVALDFSEQPCIASWSNNGEYLPCPGNMGEISGGYADRFDAIVIEGNIHINQPGLLTIPAQKDSGFYAIFGKYPPFTVQSGDHFQAVLACAEDHPNCDVSFSLEYYVSGNTILQVPDAKWDKQYDPKGSYIYADASLDPLAGQTVQFLLTVRDNGAADDDHAVWIMPHIARLGSAAIDAIPSHQLNVTNIEIVNISGIVDMSSAPPYLYDDHSPGSPASVVLFDLNSEMFFTVSTKNTHPDFSLDVYPGQYYILAYSDGIEDVPYVSGAFTGIEPSCGQPMAVLNVLPDTPVTNLVINDWNWSCGGTAERLEKPEEVSLP